MAISSAGPASDFAVGGVFGIISAALGAGTVRDVFFQLALAAYVGAFFNLNPFIDRDGYDLSDFDKKAIDYYNRFVELWKDADPELQPLVRDVKARLARLVGEKR